METLPQELLLTIDRILGKQEGDDAPSSNESVIEILNRFFPNETALETASRMQQQLEQDRKVLQAEIETMSQALQRDQDPERMYLIQENISDLLSQMTRIREKAVESEAIVRSITKDIQALDTAKRNLSLTMTTLKRFQMLVNLLEQLEVLMREQRFGEMAEALEAVKQLAVFFKPYTAVERISLAWRRMTEFQGKARALVDKDFDSFIMQDSSRPIHPSKIAQLCSVADALGDEFRSHLVDRYCTVTLKEYKRIFKSNQEAGQLDNLARRYAWYKRTLAEFEEEDGKLLPANWNVGHVLCAKFSEITSEDLVSLLAKEGDRLTVNVLMDTLQLTTDFEKFIEQKYKQSFKEIISKHTMTVQTPKPISFAFSKHMGVLVDAQDKAISEMLSAYRGSKSRTSQDGASDVSSSISVLPSSTELFYFYGQTLEQMAKLSNGPTLLELCRVFQKWLRIYADDVLLASLKVDDPQKLDRRSIDSPLNILSIRSSCVALNTAHYCHETAAQLEDRLKEKIAEEYRDQVSLQAEQDLFLGVVSNSINRLLREVESQADRSLFFLTKTDWSTMTSVSGQSSYVIELAQGVDSFVETLKELVEQKKYLRNFYDKVSNLLLTKFTNALVKSRPLRESGGEQLLIDLQVLKACLLRLPTSPDTGAPASYVKAVTKGSTNLETILKMILVPDEPHESFIHNYLLLINDSSVANFQKILDLKGTPRADQNTLMDTFLSITNTRDDLEATSLLSSLDMDPTSGSLVSMSTSGQGGNTSGTGTPLTKPGEKREVFSDLRKLVSFAVRREKEGALR